MCCTNTSSLLNACSCWICFVWDRGRKIEGLEFLSRVVLGDNVAFHAAGRNWYSFWSGNSVVLSFTYTSGQYITFEIPRWTTYLLCMLKKQPMIACKEFKIFVILWVVLLLFFYWLLVRNAFWERANIFFFQLIISGLPNERITAKAYFDWYMQKVGTKRN